MRINLPKPKTQTPKTVTHTYTLFFLRSAPRPAAESPDFLSRAHDIYPPKPGPPVIASRRATVRAGASVASAALSMPVLLMQFSTPTPLRPRLSALNLAAVCLLVSWNSLHSGHFACAAEVDGSGADLEYGIGLGRQPVEVPNAWVVEDHAEDLIERDADERGYRGDFAYFEPELVGRAPEGVDVLTEGEQLNKEAAPGETKHFVLERPKSSARRRLEEGDDVPLPDGGSEELEKRQSSGQLYISINTCSQPIPDTPIAINDPPQLKLYVSTSSGNQQPGPNATDDLAGPAEPLVSGAANFTVQGADTDVYIGVEAPSLAKGWKGNWRFEIAVTRDRPFHSYENNDPFLFMIDTDSESALFITPDLTDKGDENVIQKWLNVPQNPFGMYAFPETAWGARGLEHSVCGIKEAFGTNNSNVRIDKTMTDGHGTNDSDRMPKSQFHVQGLKRDTRYIGFLLMDGDVETEGLELTSKNLEVGRGGRVWRQFNWTTKVGMYCSVPLFSKEFTLTSLLQTTVAKSFSTSPSAPPSLMLSPPLPSSNKTPPASPPSMTSKPKHTSPTSQSPSLKSPATQHLQPSTA